MNKQTILKNDHSYSPKKIFSPLPFSFWRKYPKGDRGRVWGALLFIIILLLLTSCETQGDYLSTDTYTTISARLSYAVDSADYRVDFGNRKLATLSSGSTLGSNLEYYAQDELTDSLKVWKIRDGEPAELLLDTVVSIAPLGTFNFMQVAAGVPLQLVKDAAELTDSSQCQLQFFYTDPLQPERVTIDMLAVDQYAILLKGGKLASLPDTAKTVIASITLSRNKLSEPVIFNIQQFTRFNKGLSAKFFYRITNATTGTLLQDYNTKNYSSAASAKVAEIYIPLTKRNGKEYPAYKSFIMKWVYKSAELSFGTPPINLADLDEYLLAKGDKW